MDTGRSRDSESGLILLAPCYQKLQARAVPTPCMSQNNGADNSQILRSKWAADASKGTLRVPHRPLFPARRSRAAKIQRVGAEKCLVWTSTGVGHGARYGEYGLRWTFDSILYPGFWRSSHGVLRTVYQCMEHPREKLRRPFGQGRCTAIDEQSQRARSSQQLTKGRCALGPATQGSLQLSGPGAQQRNSATVHAPLTHSLSMRVLTQLYSTALSLAGHDL